MRDSTVTRALTSATPIYDCSGATVNLLSSTTTGNSCTRIYTQSWDATDACGNHSATVTQTITATDTHAPTIGAAGANATIRSEERRVGKEPKASEECSEANENIL